MQQPQHPVWFWVTCGPAWLESAVNFHGLPGSVLQTAAHHICANIKQIKSKFCPVKRYYCMHLHNQISYQGGHICCPHGITHNKSDFSFRNTCYYFFMQDVMKLYKCSAQLLDWATYRKWSHTDMMNNGEDFEPFSCCWVFSHNPDNQGLKLQVI